MSAMASAFNVYRNMFHSERLSTFLEAKWPNTDASFLYLCNPQKLAQAGLEYHAVGEGRCVVCLCIVKKLEPTSDPWICHANANPDCPLILMGKPKRPDRYALEQWTVLVQHRQRIDMKQRFDNAKRVTAKRIGKLVIHVSSGGKVKPVPKNKNLNNTIALTSESDDSDSDVEMT